LKKRSAGSTRPLEDFTFFVEVSLGWRVAEKLREAGFRIVTHTDVMRADATDEEWVTLAA
jgi:hypothetical protein